MVFLLEKSSPLNYSFCNAIRFIFFHMLSTYAHSAAQNKHEIVWMLLIHKSSIYNATFISVHVHDHIHNNTNIFDMCVYVCILLYLSDSIVRLHMGLCVRSVCENGLSHR